MENSRLQNVLDRLDKLTKTGDGWMARCPAHDDKNPSLSIKTAGEKILLHCFAGCSVNEVAQAIGLDLKDLYLDEPKAQPNTFYDYQDEQGNLLFQVVKSPQKKFMQRRPGKDGGWINNTRGIKRVPYRLPELQEGLKSEAMVFIPEGEKDVENLRKLGLVASCNPMGAGKWTKDLNPHFKGANVVILPDNDEPGQEHANKVAQNLQDVAASVRVLELPGLDEKGDVSDWLEAGGTGEQLAVLVHKTPEWKLARLQKHLPEIMTVEQILKAEFPEPTWVVPGLIPAGLTILAGAPKLGKSWLALCLGLALANGGKALGKVQVDQGDVLYLALEDTPRRIQDRLEQLEATSTERMALCFEWERGELGAGLLDGQLSMNPKIKLVIIDTMQKFREPSRGNHNIYASDYEAVGQLKRVADKHNIAIIIVHHTRKGGGEDKLELVSGSFGLTGAADTTITLSRARGEADGKIFITGRDVDEQELALKMDNLTGWTLLGDAKEYEQTKERLDVLNIFRDSGEPLGPKEVAEILGKRSSNIRYLIHRLVKESLLVNVSYGKYSISTNTTNTTHTTNTTNTANTSKSKGKKGRSVSEKSEVLVDEKTALTLFKGVEQGFSGSVSSVSGISGNGKESAATAEIEEIEL